VPYIGGKSQSGTWQRIINLIPPHRTFIEPFGGDAAISRRKRAAERTVIVEKDAAVASKLALVDGAEVICGCGIEFLETFRFTGVEFVYADPPYVLSTRANRKYYRHEMTDEDHLRLLRVLNRMPCPVLLSGYPCDLYAGKLRSPKWSVEYFDVMTRGRTWRTECLFSNYPRPAVPYDLAHVGANYRERWRIEKRRRNWRARLLKLCPAERATLFSALVDVMGSDKNGAAIS
jgi:DNA adenine methylase